MNKNTIIGFLIILLSIQFFTSKFYYEKILRKPYPISKRVEKQNTTQKSSEPEKVDNKKSHSAIPKSETEIINNEYDQNNDTLKQAPLAHQGTDSISIDTIYIETDKLICAISEKGGRIISIKTKEYTYSSLEKTTANPQDNDNYIELIKEQYVGGTNLTINDKKLDSEFFQCTQSNKHNITNHTTPLELEFVYEDLALSDRIIKKFTFSNGAYTIGYAIVSNQLDGQRISTGFRGGITESEREKGKNMQYDPIKLHLFDGKNVDHIKEKKANSFEKTGYYNWVGITSKYFLIALIPNTLKDADIKIEAFEENGKEEKNAIINYSFEYQRFASGTEESYMIYAGPSKLTEIKQYDIGLQKVLFNGYRWFFGADKWFPIVCEFVLWLLIQLQKGVKDYGIVIILLTIILKIVTYPLTHSSMKSMNKMKNIQPQIMKIREKYKGNTQKMNQKVMEFYKTEGINPLGGAGGCLPMVLQMPIMISLFIVLRKAIELRGQTTFIIPWIQDLSKAEILFPLGFNIPIYGGNVALLPILMAILMYFQNKMTIKDPNQKAMIYMMPVMMLVMFNNFPSGLSLYFTFSTALQVLQQMVMDKKKKLSK